jgi:hypothetical protein
VSWPAFGPAIHAFSDLAFSTTRARCLDFETLLDEVEDIEAENAGVLK